MLYSIDVDEAALRKSQYVGSPFLSAVDLSPFHANLFESLQNIQVIESSATLICVHCRCGLH
jgi:hypothetical protein